MTAAAAMHNCKATPRKREIAKLRLRLRAPRQNSRRLGVVNTMSAALHVPCTGLVWVFSPASAELCQCQGSPRHNRTLLEVYKLRPSWNLNAHVTGNTNPAPFF